VLRNGKAIFILLTFWGIQAMAQIDKQGFPLTWGQTTNSTTNNLWRALPSFDILELMAEDEIDETNKVMPFRFAYATPVNFTTSNSGRWTNYPNGDRLWILAIESSQALSLNLTFSQFNIPNGGKVYIYNEQKTDFIGPISAKRNGAQEFTILPLEGSRLIIEYYEPYAGRGLGDITISYVAQGYKDIESTSSEFAPCSERLLNAQQDKFVKNLSASTVLLLVDRGQRITTGAMVNNTSSDGTPLLLTSANSLFGDPENWVIVFGLNNENCPGTGDIGCWDRALSGAKVLSVEPRTGLALLELSEKPRTTWGVYYAGWSGDEPGLDHYVSIQHAYGTNQSYSSVAKDLTATDWFGLEVAPVSSWARGNTFQGSIGSPIFNSKGMIAGGFIGGNSACDNDGGIDYFGLIHTAFYAFEEYLDPVNSAKNSVDGFYPIFVDREKNEDAQAEIFVFPNPAADFIYIQNQSDEEIEQVFFFDSTGRLIQVERPSLPTINTSQLPNGMYEIQVVAGGKSTHSRVLVRH
jgi:hypothetical protein